MTRSFPDEAGTVAITLGDPRGIGPAVTLGALDRLGGARHRPGRSIVIGADNLRILKELPSDVEVIGVGAWDGTERSAGRIAGRAIQKAVQLALDGVAQAVVTAPIHKPSLRAAGWTAAGHTELLREMTGVEQVGMLMAAEQTRLGAPLRVLLATTHLPLRSVPDALSAELIVRQTVLLSGALETWWGLATPRIALCALNPHASDDGLFGNEEALVLTPAVSQARGKGLNLTGPLPADTVFTRALSGEFDAVVAPYHDVGMAAFKTAAFGTGVNVTLGLPFPRTSPDHGTAFDLATEPERANPSSMIEAIRLARRLARRSFDTESVDV
ncbi:MAG: 4-hydroxythreonine-4-phosphate dehydrogenase PdxA [Gemmatimonadota bacterium]